MNMMELISNYLKNEGWSFSQVAGRNALEFDYQGQYSSWTCYALAKPEYDECSFFSVYPDNISKANHAAIVEYITRANYGLPVGNFEMDWDSGELRFKTSLDFEGDRLSEILLNRLVKTNLFLMDKYTFGINKILKEGKTPGEALRIVDGS
jgi:hypothetical protein